MHLWSLEFWVLLSVNIVNKSSEWLTGFMFMRASPDKTKVSLNEFLLLLENRARQVSQRK